MKKKVEITAVLDRSGSMNSIKSQTIDGFNSYLEKQKHEIGKRGQFSLIQFNHKVESAIENLPLDNVPYLSLSNYQPSGTTALYDALGIAIKQQKKRNKNAYPDTKVITIILIITDGHENASTKFDRAKIFSRITKMREKHSWKFIYIGANQDAIFEAGKIGIPKESSVDYCLDDSGIEDVYHSVSKMIVRNSESNDLIGFEETDREKQKR